MSLFDSKRTSEFSSAMALEGYGPPSKTATSANVPPARSTCMICSRPWTFSRKARTENREYDEESTGLRDWVSH